jgi:hypothetical protein
MVSRTALTGTSSAPDGSTFGTLVGALVPEVEGSVPPSSGRAASAARACSFSTAATVAAQSPCTVRTPGGDDILRTKLKGKCALGPFLSILVV